jgi:hypothetical protein
MKQYPSQARLKELFDYNSEGFLVWRRREDVAPHVNSRTEGKRAGSFGISGGVKTFGKYFNNVTIDGIKYRSCEVVWIWHNKTIDDGLSVMQNTDTFYTKIEDLKLGFHNDRRGARHSKRCEHGYIGVTKRGKSFRATLNKIKLGTFKTELAAAAAVDAKRKEINPDDKLLNLDFNYNYENERLHRGRKPSKIKSGDSF